MLYFDERAVARRYEVAMDGAVLRWWRTAPGFSQRHVLTVALDGDTLHGVSAVEGRHHVGSGPGIELYASEVSAARVLFRNGSQPRAQSTVRRACAD